MKSIKVVVFVLLLTSIFYGCKDDELAPSTETTTFKITLTNQINLLASHVFNTPDGTNAPGPIVNQGGSYSISFPASAGSRLNFVNMLANSNDWFFALGQDGIDLFDGGLPVTGNITSAVRLYDAGTEEEDPSTIATVEDGATNGDPDDDARVRTQQEDVSNFLRAELSYAGGSFTLTLTKGVDGILTPGIVVIHAGDAPLFTRGEDAYPNGLKLLAEAGNPSEMHAYINEMGSDGAPLRLASSHTPFAPGIVYAFEGENDPYFVQGEATKNGSGLEELSEDGNNEISYEYLKGLGIPVAKSEEPGGVGPGGSLTFYLDVPKGYKLGIATMFVQSNDWFVAFNNKGLTIFDDNGSPLRGIQGGEQLYLYDAGTEVDEAVGTGANQPFRQGSANTGPEDSNPLIRRVGEIDDTQFGKGMISSGPGVVYLTDPRGGYNLVGIEIQAQ